MLSINKHTGGSGLRIYNQEDAADFLGLAGEIVSAYVSNNSLPISELPALINGVHAALSGLASGASMTQPAETLQKPTLAEARKSVTPDALISFIDGKPYKILKRHLKGHGLDPHGYRERYGLPSDYPMVCPNYSAQRSKLAKAIGLGRPGG
jgi:predicted transcriptional regulator